MAGSDTKGFLGGSMNFHVGDEDGAKESAPLLPLRVLVVTDLVPKDEHNAGASAPNEPLRVDPARFDDLFTKLRPRIAVEVPSVLSGGRPVRIDLAPTSLKSFRPDGLCAELPLLRSLLDGRLVLDRLRDGSLGEGAARGELERLWQGSSFAREVLGLIDAAKPLPATPAPAAPAAPAAPDVDALLSMVDLGGGGDEPAPAAPPPRPVAAAPASPISALIDSVVRSARPGGSGPIRPTEAIARVEKALAVQLGAILQHPEVRRLEEAWRGLKLLADRAQGVPGLELDVVSARAEDTTGVFEASVRSSGARPPVAFAVVDHVVDGSAASLARLESLALTAEAYTVPTVVSGTAKLFGLTSLDEVERWDNKAALFEAPARAPWRSLAHKPELRWVAIAMNRVLSRMPYDKSTSRVREAVVRELPDDAAGRVWTAPAFLVGALVAASFKETGWPCRIQGAPRAGVVGNLPVHEQSTGYEGEEAIAIPTEAFVSTDAQRELARLGVLCLASAPNSDSVYVMSAPTAYVTPPKRSYDSATTEPEVRLDRVPLGDQLFVARLVQFLRRLGAALPSSATPAETQPVVEAAVLALFEGAGGGGPEIRVTTSASAATVRVRPRRFVGVGLEEIELEIPLG
jgi:type VI secretion system ImpC/EvpB family protein/type VI secretion system ImpB/VipA family protein